MIDDPQLPAVGVSALDEAQARWCVWAPKARRVELELLPGPKPGQRAGRLEGRRMMEPLERGYHAVTTERPVAGQRYAYRLDGGAPLADPCSRWQPEGVGAASAGLFPGEFTWAEGNNDRLAAHEFVIYQGS